MDEGKFNDFYSFDDTSEHDEIDAYLLWPKFNPRIVPLKYWKAHRHDFSVLSLIALNMLSIPGAAFSCERTFNIGRDMIAIRR